MSAIENSLTALLTKVTRGFVREKRLASRYDRADRLSAEQIERLRQRNKARKAEDEIKAAAWSVMPKAYAAASDNGSLPANGQQIMYAARPAVLELTKGKCWKNSNYFTQVLLPDYLAEHPGETCRWDVVFDARGSFVEPHVYRKVSIGTLDVRAYVNSWGECVDAQVEPPRIDGLFPTTGPANRYKFALFCEKEGFDQLFKRSQLAERYDLAIFSSKGQSTTATRQLVDQLSQTGVTILVVHDFDRAGLMIARYLSNDSRRYTFTVAPRVIDLGLRLADVEEMKLQSEPVFYDQKKDPGEVLLDCNNVSQHEIKFLVEKRVQWNRWAGKRVELNAMTSAQLIGWLEQKFNEHGVEKVVPDKTTLALAWKRAQIVAKVNAAVDEVMKELGTKRCLKRAPQDLANRVRKLLGHSPTLSWDAALIQIAKAQPEGSLAQETASVLHTARAVLGAINIVSKANIEATVQFA